MGKDELNVMESVKAWVTSNKMYYVWSMFSLRDVLETLVCTKMILLSFELFDYWLIFKNVSTWVPLWKGSLLPCLLPWGLCWACLCLLHDLCWSEPEESINSFWGRVIHSPQRKPPFQFLLKLQNTLAFGMAGSGMARWWESGTLFKFVFSVQSPTPRRIPRVTRRRSYVWFQVQYCKNLLWKGSFRCW